MSRLPNLLTIARIAAMPVLAWLAARHDAAAFGAVLFAALATDALDGTLARALGATSAFGALLDSIADTLLFLVAAGGIVVLYEQEVAAHALAFWIVPVAWITENAAALLRYGRLSSFHTYLSRAAAAAMALFAVVLFLRGFEPRLLRVAAAVVTLATLEEFVLLYLLPRWTPNVGGLIQVLHARQQGRSR